MREHNPDKWEILKINNNGKVVHKILGNWSGGYLDGDSYRVSSGITGLTEEGDYILFENYSGSTYKCHKNMKSLGLMTSGVYSRLLDQIENEENITAELISLEQLKEDLKESSDNF